VTNVSGCLVAVPERLGFYVNEIENHRISSGVNFLINEKAYQSKCSKHCVNKINIYSMLQPKKDKKSASNNYI